jgi:hypothetical protein
MTPLIRKLVIRIANYPVRLVPSGKYFLTVISGISGLFKKYPTFGREKYTYAPGGLQA